MMKMRKKYGIDEALGFNFFASISGQYYKENFRSDILKLITDFNTDLIGNRQNTARFLKFIEQDDAFEKVDKIMVEGEKGRTDLLVRDGTNAVITENKIDGPVDQPNQLHRSMNAVNRRNLNVSAIVYLTLVPGKRPARSYSPEYVDYRPELDKKTICVSAVERIGGRDLVHGFLRDCEEGSTSETARVYIAQYRKRLMHIEGKAIVKEFSKDVIKEIYSSKDKIATVRDLASAWDDRGPLLGEIVRDFIIEMDGSFVAHPYEGTIHKRLDENVSVAYCTDGSIGFVYAPGKTELPKRLIRDLESILSDPYFEKFSVEPLSDGEWVFRRMDLADYYGELSTIEEATREDLKKLEQLYRDRRQPA